MCGIYGVINGQSVTGSLMAGLSSLSYRGYDSAGIAVIGPAGLERRRAEGKLEQLACLLESAPVEGTVGIAHTRWATHGSPTRRNAHPHMTAKVAVVHNGIIENCLELRKLLEGEGYVFQSDTDSEVVPLMVTRFLDMGMDEVSALRGTSDLLDGSFAIAAVFNDCPDMLFAMRQGSPLVLSQSRNGCAIASDANALGEDARDVCYLQDGDLACIGKSGAVILDASGTKVERQMLRVDIKGQRQGKEGYRHFMLKEIHQQPEVLAKTAAHYLDSDAAAIRLPELPFRLETLQRLSIVACGTSHYAGMIGKYWLEGFSGLPVNLDIASEYRYRNAPLSRDEAALFISQSGETADTLAALRYARNAGQKSLSLVNVPNSSMAQESDGYFPTLAGTEIGVASTKAFTAQMTVLLLFALAVARSNRLLDAVEEKRLTGQVLKLPEVMSEFLKDDDNIRCVARKLQHAANIIYLGRGIAYPLALEGALKLKEISYIHAEAYPAGELKHGPIALIDDQMPIVMIAPPGPLFGKSISNLREVASRGARIILISNQDGANEAAEFIEDAIVMPDTEELLVPILYTLPLQLLAYHVAVLKGTDVDQPRNLAKSVTVE
jgi:glucosamine--fructose-6-phosphate aminotransferase (isomerizing)